MSPRFCHPRRALLSRAALLGGPTAADYTPICNRIVWRGRLKGEGLFFTLAIIYHQHHG